MPLPSTSQAPRPDCSTVAPRGWTQWVRNALATGRVRLVRGRSVQEFAVRLVPANPNATAVEIKLGVVTALIGVPFFLAMIFRERRLLDGASS